MDLSKKTRMRRLFILTLCTLLCVSLNWHGAIAQETDQIQWLSFEEAMSKMETEKRKVLVDIYTDWCGWCKHMDKTTFSEEHIAKYINEKFYPVKFDAEQKENIQVGDKIYKYVKGSGNQKGYHEFAMTIAMGQLTFPTIVFIDENIRVLQPLPGFKDPYTFEMIMTYYGNDYFRQIPWSKYQKTYRPMIKTKPVLISD